MEITHSKKQMAVVSVYDRNTGKTMLVKNKLKNHVMSPPAAYALAKKFSNSPLIRPELEFKVKLITV